jgi:hypothetical protein
VATSLPCLREFSVVGSCACPGGRVPDLRQIRSLRVLRLPKKATGDLFGWLADSQVCELHLDLIPLAAPRQRRTIHWLGTERILEFLKPDAKLFIKV